MTFGLNRILRYTKSATTKINWESSEKIYWSLWDIVKQAKLCVSGSETVFVKHIW